MKFEIGKYYKHVDDGDIILVKNFDEDKIMVDVIHDPRNMWYNRAKFLSKAFTFYFRCLPAYNTPLYKAVNDV